MDSNASIFRIILSAVRRLLIALLAMAAAAGVLMIARSIVNAAVLLSYNHGTYVEIPEYLLTYLPFGENYVALYNLGNIEYRLGNYGDAVYCYMRALASDPPERDEECRIRVNLAFSMCHTIDFDHLDLSDSEAVKQAVTILENARGVLTEHECASEPVGSDDGHYRDADLLKHDIDEMLEKLKKSQSENEGGEGGSGDEEEQDESQSSQQDKEEQTQDQTMNLDQEQSMRGREAREEMARQKKLQEELERQKRDLEEQDANFPYDYEYIDSGSVQGYGDGTLW